MTKTGKNYGHGGCDNQIHSSRENPRKAGFTLIELLIVVAVIAILASLLMGGLSRAKGTAKSVKCKSNLRQIGLGLAMYVGDFSKYPVGDSAVEEKFWFDYLEPQTGSAWDGKLYQCPGGEGFSWRGVTRFNAKGVLETGGPDGDYGYNRFGSSVSGVGGTGAGPHIGELGLGGTVFFEPYRVKPLPEVSVSMPSDMIALGDAFRRMNGKHIVATSNADLGIDGTLIGGTDAVWRELEQAARKRHNSSANITFCDGHVEGNRLPKFFGNSDEVLQRWNIDHRPHRDRIGGFIPN